ncbi:MULTISPECIES: Rha family transcriptional regulator [unclassified Endozoicomonas]|uniref:Rha family transcriptional regulator n=2 Tax=Endozoicomonas TaxID=305899 RepID=UPI003BB58B7C
MAANTLHQNGKSMKGININTPHTPIKPSSSQYGFIPDNAVTRTEMVMSSREIAKVLDKEHKNVKRDIEVMLSKLGMGTLKFEHTYVNPQNKQEYTEYQLPRFEFEVLITGYDVKRRAAVINRWYELESGQSKPLAPLIQEPQLDPHQLLEINMDTSLKAISFVKEYGFKGNQAMLAADRLVKSQINFSPLEAMGQKQLVAPVQAMTFTPTQLGQMMEPPQDPRQVNKLLESAGLQIKIDSLWVPTDQGQPLCEILDTGKAHNNGTPVKQVKWYQNVLDRLQPALPDESKTESIDQDSRYADPAPESEIVGSDTDEEPVQRKQKRKRNRYELDDYFSLVELGEFIGRSRQHVVEVLEKHRLIKWIGQGKKGKYLLTEKGWQYGLMYDPSEICFHNRNSKRLTTSNAQPVLGYDILKFF